MTRIKKLLRNVLKVPGVTAPFTPLTRDCAVVFMLHRFHDPDIGIKGHDPVTIQRMLEYLRRHRYNLISLLELLQRLTGEGPPLRHEVAFTIDDGYVEHATQASPVFAAFDCPVTTFVTTGFLDGQLWLWWDQIEYIFRKTSHHELRLEINNMELKYHWNDDATRERAQLDFTQRCKDVSDVEKQAHIVHLAEIAEVELPARVPIEYSAMSWEQLRLCEKRGMTFGPHTVTHPVLSQLPEEQSRREIIDSWQRLCSEAQQPLPIFAYPNGRSKDFGPREIAVLKTLGFMGAVSSIPGYNSVTSFRAQVDGAFRLHRFGCPDTLPHMIQYVAGVERISQMLRSAVIRDS